MEHKDCMAWTYAKIFNDFFSNDKGSVDSFIDRYLNELVTNLGKDGIQAFIDYLENWNIHTAANEFQSYFDSFDFGLNESGTQVDDIASKVDFSGIKLGRLFKKGDK